MYKTLFFVHLFQSRQAVWEVLFHLSRVIQMQVNISQGVLESILHLEAMEAGRTGRFKNIEDREQKITLLRNLVSEMVLATILKEINLTRNNPSLP